MIFQNKDFNIFKIIYKFQQEVGDDLSVYGLNIPPKVSNLPSLVAINLMKIEI